MFNYIVRRLVYGLVTLIALSIIVFSLLQMSGGGPLNRLKSNPRITQDYVQSLEEFYGLDQPAWVQYRIWATNYVQGGSGVSRSKAHSRSSRSSRAAPAPRFASC